MIHSSIRTLSSKRNEKMIVVEGYYDKYIVADSGFLRKPIKIGSCKGKVLGISEEHQVAIYIVDKAPYSGKLSDLRNYIEKHSRRTIKLLARKDDGSKPLHALKISSIQESCRTKTLQKSFGLPRYPEDMHKILHINKKENVYSFLNELIEANDEINTLKNGYRRLFE